ncbi:MAG: hypothetical protein V4671_17190 [Armatimonadota bacterium]
MAEKAAFQYQKLWEASPNNSYLKAEYAFAHAVGVWTLLYYRYTPEQQRLRNMLGSYPAAQNARRCRDESLKELPSAPEVWAMAAESKLDQGQYKEAYALAERAMKLDPEWGYAHYTFGKALSDLMSLEKNQRKKNDWARKALAELQRAEQLDPSLSKGNIQLRYASAYEQLGQFERAVECLDRRIAVNASLGGTAEQSKSLLDIRQRVAAKAKARTR